MTHGYVEDMAWALTLAVEAQDPPHNIYHVGEQVAWSQRELVDLCGQAVGWKGIVATYY